MDQERVCSLPPEASLRNASRSTEHQENETTENHHYAATQERVLSSPSPQNGESLTASLRTPGPHGQNAETISKSKHPRKTEPMFQSWVLELMLLLISMTCLGFIIAFFWIHDGRPIEGWTLYFSLNAVASALGVAFRSTLVMAVSAGLAQGKWTWFHKRISPLETFEVIDAGSRETLGSFKLLWHMRGRHPITLGAIVIALGFLIDPLLQAALDLGGRLDAINTKDNVNVATMAKTENFDGGTICVTPVFGSHPNVSTAPEWTISAAFWQGLDATLNASFYCPSGNCTWPDFASVAICSSCFDISGELNMTTHESWPSTTALSRFDASKTTTYNPVTQQPSTYAVVSSTGESLVLRGTEEAKVTATAASSTFFTTYSLDYLDFDLSNVNGFWKSSNSKQGEVFRMKIQADQSSTIHFKDSETLLAAFTMIRANQDYAEGAKPWPDAGATAMECGLTLCLNLYRSNVSQGILHEEVVATATKKVPTSWQPLSAERQLNSTIPEDFGNSSFNPVFHPDFAYRTNFQLDPVPFGRDEINGKYEINQTTILSTVDFIESLIAPDRDASVVKVVVGSSEDVYGTPVLQPLHLSRNISQTFESIALSLSHAIRNLGKSPEEGITSQWVIFYKVRWEFLALPLALITVGIVFLILSIIESHKSNLPGWKSSSLATMLYGPDEALRAQLRAIGQIDSMKAAGKVEVVLLGSADGGPVLMAPLLALAGPDMDKPCIPSGDSIEHPASPTLPEVDFFPPSYPSEASVGRAESFRLQPLQRMGPSQAYTHDNQDQLLSRTSTEAAAHVKTISPE